MRIVLILSLLTSFLFASCQSPNKEQKGPSFAQKVKQSKDTDGDGHNDLEERLLQRNPMVADLPSFRIHGDAHPSLKLSLLHPLTRNTMELALKLNRDQVVRTLASRKAIKAIFTAMRLQKTPSFPESHDGLVLELGCLSPGDRMQLKLLQEMELEAFTLSADLKLYSSHAPVAPRFQRLHANLAFLSTEGTQQHFNLANLISHYSSNARHHRLDLRGEIINNQLEVKAMAQDGCFFLDLATVEYQQNHKTLQLEALLQSMARTNATVMFIDGDKQWSKSVHPAGSVKDVLSQVGLGTIIASNHIHTTFNNIPQALDGLEEKRWFFLASDAADLTSDARAATYILAHLGAQEFKQLVPPRKAIAFELDVSDSGSLINHIRPMDQLMMEASFQEVQKLPAKREKHITGEVKHTCDDSRINREAGTSCVPKWIRRSHACLHTTSYVGEAPRKNAFTHWHPSNLSFTIQENGSTIRPTLVTKQRAFYWFDVKSTHLPGHSLSLAFDSNVRDNYGRPLLASAQKIVRTKDVSSKLRCLKESTVRTPHAVPRLKRARVKAQLLSW